jgi:APA family basic amino acid/polyamine antiporter
MAMTFASYAVPAHPRPVAAAAAAALTAVNYVGVRKTALVTRVIVALVLVALAVVVVSIWAGGGADLHRLWPLAGTSVYGVLQAAGFLFFAFAGYARIATLGEEVRDPARTIPRAVPIALAIALAIYAAVAISVLAGADVRAIAASPAPLATAVGSGTLRGAVVVVRIGAAIAALGVLLSLLAGVSRTTFAMAANHDLPHALAAVHPRFRIPHRAELAIGAIVTAVAAAADVRSAIGFSSFAVLVYYGIANASAWTLSRDERRWPRAVAGAGVGGCVALAATLPWTSVVAGAGVLATGAVIYAVTRARS